MQRTHVVSRGLGILGAFLLVFALTAFLLAYLGSGRDGRGGHRGAWGD